MRSEYIANLALAPVKEPQRGDYDNYADYLDAYMKWLDTVQPQPTTKRAM